MRPPLFDVAAMLSLLEGRSRLARHAAGVHNGTSVSSHSSTGTAGGVVTKGWGKAGGGSSQPVVLSSFALDPWTLETQAQLYIYCKQVPLSSLLLDSEYLGPRVIERDVIFQGVMAGFFYVCMIRSLEAVMTLKGIGLEFLSAVGLHSSALKCDPWLT